MGCYWIIEGNFVVNNYDEEKVVSVMQNYEFDFDKFCELKGRKTQYTFSFYDERGYSFSDDFAESIAPFVVEGSMEVKNDDEESFFLYQFDNGKFNVVDGEQFIYYPGDEDIFVDSLPEKVIDVVLKRYLKQEKGE